MRHTRLRHAVSATATRLVESRLGELACRLFVETAGKYIFNARERSTARFSVARLRARRQRGKSLLPLKPRLHLGAGGRRVPNWLNVDVMGSDHDVDVTTGILPWSTDSFDCVVSQQLIEHIELEAELIPLLAELKRVTRRGGLIWLACPDMSRVCNAYVTDGGASIISDKISRKANAPIKPGMPPQHIINYMFHHEGHHKNLYDFELLRWACRQAGLDAVSRVSESDMLSTYPEFPVRGDDWLSLYIRICVEKSSEEP